jgi:CheY-like chemotaxis protein
LKQLEDLNPAETDAPHMPRILIVDDDLFLRAALRNMLELDGYEIEEASDGQDAVRKFRAHPADLVLCDMFMPKTDGLEVLRELASELVGANIIAMSGGGYGGTVDVLPIARHLGAAAVLTNRSSLRSFCAWSDK